VPEVYDLLLRYQPALKELFNVSQVEILRGSNFEGKAVRVRTVAADGTKCERCWNFTEDVGQDVNYPTVCLRCAEALTAIGFAPYTAGTTEAK